MAKNQVFPKPDVTKPIIKKMKGDNNKMKNLNIVNVFIVSLLMVFVFSVMCFAKTYPLPENYNEAPQLKKLVEKGEIPAVEERLPEEPLVVGPGTIIYEENLDWEVGKYGGGKLVTSSPLPNLSLDIRDALYEHIIENPRGITGDVYGNLVKDFEVNENNTEYTFYMRKGLRWSDGVPVTMEDVRFAYEDVMLNEKITPVFPSTYRSGSEPMELEIIDDYTFKIKFAEPYGRFLALMGLNMWGGYWDLIKPKHYLKDYHIKYTSLEDMQEDLEAEELKDEWWELFSSKDVLAWQNTQEKAIGFPSLTPWIRKEGPEGVLVFERNPYYHKVDIEGNQLPYIDTYESVAVNDQEMIAMKVISGEVNMLRIHATLNKMPVFKGNEERGGYKVSTSTELHNAPIGFFLNLTYEDPVWREVVRDVRFRRAINMAMLRPEMIETVYFGRADPPQWIPGEYDPKEANRLLDEMGLDQRNSQGYRLGPDGEQFEILLEYYEATPEWTPVAELLAASFEEVGLRTTLKQISSELWQQRDSGNTLMASMDWTNPPLVPYLQQDYLPDDQPSYGILWSEWHNSDGRSGEEPPEWIKEIFEIDKELSQINPNNRDEAREIEEKLDEWMYEYVPQFPITSGVPNVIIIPTNLGNFAHDGLGCAAQMSLEQSFFK